MFARTLKGVTMAERLKHTGALLNAQKRFSQVTQGAKYGPNFRQYLQLANGEVGSYFHDIPLELKTEQRTVRMVVEVPRWSNGKFEISKKLDFNPIVQDVKKGKVRFVHNIFPFHGYIQNYGAIPQTWEDPTREAGLGSIKGDNDPLDCCEIGSMTLHMGDITEVKILGSLALIDDGELDWKVIAINVNDPLALKLNNLEDVEVHMPGLLSATREWFKKYKIPAGKPANEFAFGGQYKDAQYTVQIVRECHEAWKKLISGTVDGDNLPAIRRAGHGIKALSDEEDPMPIPSEVGSWHYV
ncbi:probable Inorganic pyrophosphatase, mitochondrial [Zygosaccharomyces bailii]|nr:probable Inorganic pyrophosphatase, mitochondrial [Zygosaccharomyces bailii]